ncbi:hypothetical protein JFQ93_001462 [Aeromonas sobria]|jgi:hypothetical protein|nr:hypothetical protein [Aeromonas sobria]
MRTVCARCLAKIEYGILVPMIFLALVVSALFGVGVQALLPSLLFDDGGWIAGVGMLIVLSVLLQHRFQHRVVFKRCRG